MLVNNACLTSEIWPFVGQFFCSLYIWYLCWLRWWYQCLQGQSGWFSTPAKAAGRVCVQGCLLCCVVCSRIGSQQCRGIRQQDVDMNRAKLCPLFCLRHFSTWPPPSPWCTSPSCTGRCRTHCIDIQHAQQCWWTMLAWQINDAFTYQTAMTNFLVCFSQLHRQV